MARRALLLRLALAALLSGMISALDNGVARTPPMGANRGRERDNREGIVNKRPSVACMMCMCVWIVVCMICVWIVVCVCV